MTDLSPLLIPDAVTFEQAIALTQSLLSEMQLENGAESEIEAVTQKLVSTETGARGFFVTYLTDSGTLGDEPSLAVIRALQSSPEIVSELLVKNLAMSAAMVLSHRSRGDEFLARESERVRDRTSNLIRLLQLPPLPQRAKQLSESARTGEGVYEPFLKRWGYDVEQRQAIQQVLQPFT